MAPVLRKITGQGYFSVEVAIENLEFYCKVEAVFVSGRFSKIFSSFLGSQQPEVTKLCEVSDALR